MDGRLISMLIAFIVIAGFGIHIKHSTDLEEKRQTMLNTQKDLQTMQAELDTKKSNIEVTRKDLEAKKERIVKADSVMEKRANADKYEADRIALASDFQQAILQVRTNSVGLAIPEVKLLTGATFTDAKVTKVTESDITLAHAQGVSRVPGKDMSPELLDRFRIDDPVLSIGKKPAPKVVAAPIAPKPVMNTAPTINPAKVADARLQIDRLNLLITQTQASLDSLNGKVAQARARHARNNFFGKSDSSAMQIREAEQAAAQVQAQLNAQQLQVPVLQRKLSDAEQGR